MKWEFPKNVGVESSTRTSHDPFVVRVRFEGLGVLCYEEHPYLDYLPHDQQPRNSQWQPATCQAGWWFCFLTCRNICSLHGSTMKGLRKAPKLYLQNTHA